jgi:hypothetical protein
MRDAAGRGKEKSDLAVAFFFETLAETVGFTYMLQAARSQVCARLRIPPAGRAGALLACPAEEKKKATLRSLFSLKLWRRRCPPPPYLLASTSVSKMMTLIGETLII